MYSIDFHLNIKHINNNMKNFLIEKLDLIKKRKICKS